MRSGAFTGPAPERPPPGERRSPAPLAGGNGANVVNSTPAHTGNVAAAQLRESGELRRGGCSMSGILIPAALLSARFVPIPTGSKSPRFKWGDVALSAAEAQAHVVAGGNLALRVGAMSANLVDADLDCSEALELASLYLPHSGAQFGRLSKPLSHRLYSAPGAVYASFGDPLDGSMLVELRADGRDGGAHLTLIPPSIADGEQREWLGETVEPAEVESTVLARRMAWLAIGCVVMRHVSEYAARRPGPDLLELLWEADPQLGRAAFRWLGKPSPDEPRHNPKPRREMSNEELRLAELVAAIPNDFAWNDWNRVGMAIYAASGGSEEGFIAFDDLSARSPKYDPHAVRERWNNYRRSPPTRISLGTLIHLAREHGWHRGAA
jgi:hypothetical protein